MGIPYAKLTLYFGLCDSDGCLEEKYYLPKNDWDFSRRYIKAFSVVERNLNSKMFGNIQVGRNPLIRSEDDAKKAIEFYSKTIPQMSELTELVDCGHGQIRFFRRLKFNGWAKKNEKELIKELREFNYNPPYYEKEWREKELKKNCSNVWKKIVQEELAKLDLDKPWKDALEFIQT